MRPYQKLRLKLKEYDYTQEEIARMMGRSLSYVAKRFGGKGAWDMDDVYFFLHQFDIPAEEMHLYFPEHGIWQEGKRCYKLVRGQAI